jgi:hypothetical protein
MVFTANGLSRNINISFSEVRKDLTDLKAKFKFLENKVEEIKIKDSELRSEVFLIRQTLSKKKKVPPVKTKAKIIDSIKNSIKKELEFYDVKTKSKFKTSNYREVVKGKTVFAVTRSLTDEYDCYRILRRVK